MLGHGDMGPIINPGESKAVQSAALAAQEERHRARQIGFRVGAAAPAGGGDGAQAAGFEKRAGLLDGLVREQWHTKDGSHRSAYGFGIERVYGSRADDHAGDSGSLAGAQDRAEIAGILYAAGDEQPW